MTWIAYDVWGQALHAYAYTKIYNELPPQRALPQEADAVQEGQDTQPEEDAGQDAGN